MSAHRQKNEAVVEAAENYDEHADDGSILPIYEFGEGVLDGPDLGITDQAMTIPGFNNSIELNLENPYKDMA